MSTALLVLGYVLAVPFTVFIPGFLRLWRRRELWVFACAEVGAVLIATGWALRGGAGAAVFNYGFAVVLAVLYAVEGRKRARLTA